MPAVAGLVALVAVTAAAVAAGDWQTTQTRPYTVAVVQGNVPRLGLDFNAQREAVLRNHVTRTLTLAADARAGRVATPDLVLWPENSSDIDPFRNPDAYALIDQAAKAVGVPILVGALADGPDPATTVRNSAYVWDPRHRPRGELRQAPPGAVRRVHAAARDRPDGQQGRRPGPRDFVPGDRPGILHVGPATLGDVICFEVAYDGLIVDIANDAELIVVQTNNATFGRSTRPASSWPWPGCARSSTAGRCWSPRPAGSARSSPRTGTFRPAGRLHRGRARPDGVRPRRGLPSPDACGPDRSGPWSRSGSPGWCWRRSARRRGNATGRCW